MADTTDSRLAAQYEAYPYPQRDPREEAKRLLVGSPSLLTEIDHWVFGAARPASRPLAALVAGGGTGDGTIMLAQLLAAAGRDARVTYLDRSAQAMAIAQARAAARSLTNIEFRQGSLLDLPTMGLGPFDYIDCCGVLHHLPDPATGLAALVSVLAPGGGMGLMVYAPHGRTGVYMAQDALRALAPPEEAPPARLDIARRVLRHLPETAWLRRNPYLSDIAEGGDAGLYDLLLNPRDRAFAIPALFDLLDGAGLEATCLVEPLRYEPATYLPDPRLRARIAGMGLRERAALAEALTGNMITHVVYCVRAGEAPPAPDAAAADAVPVARHAPAEELARAVRPDHTIAFLFDGLRVPVPLPPLAAPILRLVDGRRSVGEIGAAMAERGAGAAAFARAWPASYATLSALNRILLAPPP